MNSHLYLHYLIESSQLPHKVCINVIPLLQHYWDSAREWQGQELNPGLRHFFATLRRAKNQELEVEGGSDAGGQQPWRPGKGQRNMHRSALFPPQPRPSFLGLGSELQELTHSMRIV